MTTKKAIIIGGITLLAGAMIYIIVQYRKLMQYVMNYKGVKVRELSANKIAFDLSIEFVNKSNLAFRLMKQRYQVYVNDKFVSKGGSDKPVVVQPNGSTTLTNLVSFNPTDVLRALEKNWTTLLLKPEGFVIRIDYQIYTSLFGFSIPIKNTYSISLKEIRDLKAGNK